MTSNFSNFKIENSLYISATDGLLSTTVGNNDGDRAALV